VTRPLRKPLARTLLKNFFNIHEVSEKALTIFNCTGLFAITPRQSLYPS
jgi:hypothetical protein